MTQQRFTYTYNGAGQRVQVDEAAGAVTTWTCDQSYRLTNEHRTGTPSFQVTYTYDLAGKGDFLLVAKLECPLLGFIIVMNDELIDDLRRLAGMGTTVCGLVRYAISKSPRLATNHHELSRLFRNAFALSHGRAAAVRACLLDDTTQTGTSGLFADILRTQSKWNVSSEESPNWLSLLHDRLAQYPESNQDTDMLVQYLGSEGLQKLTSSELEGLLLLIRSYRVAVYDLTVVAALADRLQSRIDGGQASE